MTTIGCSHADHAMRRQFDEMLHGELYAHGSHFPYMRHIENDYNVNHGSAVGEIVNTDEKWAVSVDVSHFKPGEIKVTEAGNEVTIEGNHEVMNDHHGSIERSFIRKYVLPEDANMEAIRSSLNDKGHLHIEAPKKTHDPIQPKAIPITKG